MHILTMFMIHILSLIYIKYAWRYHSAILDLVLVCIYIFYKYYIKLTIVIGYDIYFVLLCDVVENYCIIYYVCGIVYTKKNPCASHILHILVISGVNYTFKYYFLFILYYNILCTNCTACIHLFACCEWLNGMMWWILCEWKELLVHLV